MTLVGDPGQANWKEVVPHRADVTLEGMEFFKNYFIVFERENGLQKMTVTDVRPATAEEITHRHVHGEHGHHH